jgi:hypothetical protein
VRVTHAPAPWLDDNNKHLMKCRDAAGRVYKRNRCLWNLRKYKLLRNKVKQLIRNNKLKFSYKVLDPKLPNRVLLTNIHKCGISDNRKSSIQKNFQLDELNDYFSSLPYEIHFFSKLRTMTDITIIESYLIFLNCN